MNASQGLPQRIDPYRLAGVNGIIEGDCAISGMHRLNDYLLDKESAENARAQVTMRFYRDNQRRVIIQGEITAQLVLQCQRCLLGLDWSVKTTLALAVVADDDGAAQVPREYDPLIVGDDGISPAALVEDELILAMPAVARCQQTDCPRAPDELAVGKPSKNLFAVLRNMEFDNDDNTT